MIKLASLLKEEPLVPVSTEHIPEQDNTYMFFQNLQTICNATKELLEMNPEQVSKLLADGHGWALDHIATSTDDISEVYQFVKNSLTENHLQEAEEVGAPTTRLSAVKAGGIVVPMSGPHKGIKHLVTYSKGNRLNIKPMGLKPGQNKYAAGTTAVNINQVKILKEDLGAFRRLVITSSKSDLLKKELEDFMKRPNIKSDYAGMKFNMKPGAKPDVIVVDIEGQSGTALANKLSDIAKKFDNGAQIKVRKELKLKPTK